MRRVPTSRWAFALLLGARIASAQPDESKKSEAEAHFRRGLELAGEEAWDGAYAEYARSRALYPTKSATKNAAICLRNLRRYDDALDMFETFLREFPALSEQDRAFAQGEIERLQRFVGSIELRGLEDGASVTLDGRERAPATARLLRVAAGTHLVRIQKQGFDIVERRVDVASGQTISIDVRLVALTQAGRLHVDERSGQPALVILDGVATAPAPWEGPTSVGLHNVMLRGEGNLGTQPIAVPVRRDDLTTVSLELEPLVAEVRVEPTPANAIVAIDGVSVGRGVWEGRVRAGSHRVEIAAEGFLPRQVTFAMDRDARRALKIPLERDPDAGLWTTKTPPRFFVDARVAGAIGPTLGGAIAGDCGSCSTSPVLGAAASGRFGYQLSSGLGFSADAGYAWIRQSVDGRPDRLTPLPLGGTPANLGEADDTLDVRGPMAGASLSLHRGRAWSWLARLGLGVWLASTTDARAGRYTTVASVRPDGTLGTPASYGITSEQTQNAWYGYLAPEFRVNWRLSPRFEVGAGIEVPMFVALEQPYWDPSARVTTGTCGATGAPGCVTDGFAVHDEQALMGKFVILFLPGVVVRYQL